VDINEYEVLAFKTDGGHDLAYYFLKIGSECGEVQQDYANYIKHKITYAELQKKVQNELGDMMWYWLIIHGKLGLDPTVTLQQNVIKLRKRYGPKKQER